MADLAFIGGDIAASTFGDILLVNDNDDIIQMAVNNINTVYGGNEFHPHIGNTVFNGRYKMSENGLKEIAGACKDAIMLDYRVANVVEVVAKNISTPNNYGMCDISFVLITVDGVQLNSSVAIQLS